jgi:hypothetical protein
MPRIVHRRAIMLRTRDEHERLASATGDGRAAVRRFRASDGDALAALIGEDYVQRNPHADNGPPQA